MLESPIAVVEAIQILEDVKNGDIAFDRTLKADSAIDCPKMEVLERLPEVIDQIRQTVFDSHECFDKLSNSPSQRQAAPAGARSASATTSAAAS